MSISGTQASFGTFDVGPPGDPEEDTGVQTLLRSITINDQPVFLRTQEVTASPSSRTPMSRTILLIPPEEQLCFTSVRHFRIQRSQCSFVQPPTQNQQDQHRQQLEFQVEDVLVRMDAVAS